MRRCSYPANDTEPRISRTHSAVLPPQVHRNTRKGTSSFPKPVPVFGRTEGSTEQQSGKPNRALLCGGEPWPRRHGRALATKPGQQRDFLRLQGAPDLPFESCKANERGRDGWTKKGGAVLGGGLSDAKEQQGTQRPAGARDGAPKGRPSPPGCRPAACSCTRSCRLQCCAARPETNWSRRSSPHPLL